MQTQQSVVNGISSIKGKPFLLLVQLIFILATTSYAVSAAADGAVLEIPTVLVKGGCFLMGDQFGDGGLDEKPVHEVCVDDYHLGKFEVTQAEWARVMKNNPSQDKQGNNYPVENVSWYDAQAFIKKLQAATGLPWRLPTEAEWEYAARSGGKKQKFPGAGSGEDLPEYAWFGANSDSRTHPVGEKKPNELGLYDMAGNVLEWVQDRYDPDYYRQSAHDNPKGDPFGVNRIMRGGSADQDAGFLRASYRDYMAPGSHGKWVGLRLALPADGKTTPAGKGVIPP